MFKLSKKEATRVAQLLISDASKKFGKKGFLEERQKRIAREEEEARKHLAEMIEGRKKKIVEAPAIPVPDKMHMGIREMMQRKRIVELEQSRIDEEKLAEERAKKIMEQKEIKIVLPNDTLEF